MVLLKLNSNYLFLSLRVEFPPEPKVDNGIKALIKQCLEKDPEKRITIDEIMVNTFYKKINCQ